MKIDLTKDMIVRLPNNIAAGVICCPFMEIDTDEENTECAYSSSKFISFYGDTIRKTLVG